MFSRYLVFFTIIFLGSLPAVVDAAEIYVSNDGLDTAGGQTPGDALRTLRHATSLAEAGDVIRLKRGDIWRETLELPVDDVTVTAYGDPADPKPVISAADPVDRKNVLSERPLDKAKARILRFRQNMAVQVFFKDQRYQRVDADSVIEAPGQWSLNEDEQVLTVGIPLLSDEAGSPLAGLEVSVRDYAVILNGRSNIKLEDLRIEKAGRTGILADFLQRGTIVNCEVAGCYITGIRSSDPRMRRDMVIRGNEITDCGGGGIGFGGRLAGWIIEENVIRRCGTLTQGIVGFGDGREASFQWTSGIKIWGWGGKGWVEGYVIRNNLVADCLPVSWAPDPASTHGHGIWCDEVLAPTSRPQIHGNTVINCFSRGVYLEKTDDHDAFDNLIIHCAQVRYTAGMEAQSNPLGYDVELDRPDDNVPRQVSGNRFFKNTVVGGWWSFSVNCSSGESSIANTHVSDNILVGKNGRSANLYLFGGGANDGIHGSGNRYLRNCFGKEGGSWVWGEHLYRTYEALETASGGAVAGSVRGEPLFEDPAKENYRLKPGSPCIGAAEDGSDLGARFPRPPGHEQEVAAFKLKGAR